LSLGIRNEALVSFVVKVAYLGQMARRPAFGAQL